MSARRSEEFGVDDFVTEALAANVQHFGVEKCYVAAEHRRTFTIVPIPHLCLQWLIEANGWPLGRVTQSGGQFGTQKSTFIFQMIKWYLAAGGTAMLIDTENKTSDTLLRSIIPDEYFDVTNPRSKRFQIFRARTVNEWQQMLIKQQQFIKEKVEALGRKPNFPMFWAVDSMLGASSEEGLEQLQVEGEAKGRGYSDMPILISQFLRAMPESLLGLPITLHMSHHEKPAIGGHGMSRAGGKAPDFYATLDLQFKRGGVSAMGKSMEFSRVAYQAKNITLCVRKSSMGSDVDKEMTVAFCWRFEGNKQISWWDWDAATAMLLDKYSTQLKGILDVNSATKQNVGQVFWSEALGIKSKDSIPAAEFGRLIESQTELRAKIADALHIQQYPLFDGMMAE